MKHILLIYHFFHPDTVISARLFADLAEYLAENDFQVTVFTGNKLIRSERKLDAEELWGKVEIRRFSRPGFPQGNNVGRLLNSGILQLKWILAFFKRRKDFDAVIAGTDPQFAYLMYPFFRLMNRNVKLIHWCFDLYPEVILAGSPGWMKFLAGFVRPFAGFAYLCTDKMVDIGPCMRRHLQKYGHHAHCATLTPWALVEPETIPEPDPGMRKELFGNAKIGLLYSGTVGHAHDITPFIELARECRRKGIDAAFCFAGYGNCYREQTSGITAEDTNIHLAGFASESDLEKRLASADIHLVSLRSGWEGVVVPSKFFGSLAMGRPVLFSGSETGEIAHWIREYGIGKILSPETAEFLRFPDEILKLRQHVFQIYGKYFNKLKMLDGWNSLLR